MFNLFILLLNQLLRIKQLLFRLHDDHRLPLDVPAVVVYLILEVVHLRLQMFALVIIYLLLHFRSNFYLQIKIFLCILIKHVLRPSLLLESFNFSQQRVVFDFELSQLIL